MEQNQFQTSRKERNSYALYFLGQNMFYVLASFVQQFFTDKGITAAAVGVIFIIARVWDAVNDPLFGIVVDKSHLKGGKFLPWLRISGVLILITTVLLYALPSGLSLPVKTILAAVLYICWGMSYTVSDVPAYALSTAMTTNIQERTTLITRGRLTSNIGMLLAMVLIPILYPRIGWLPTAAIFSVAGFLCMLPIMKNGKERCDEKERTSSMKQMFQYLKGNKYLLIFYGAIIVLNLTNTSAAVVTYFTGNCLGNVSLATPLLLCTMIGPLAFAMFLPSLTKKTDKFYIFAASIIISIAASIGQFLVGYDSFGLVMFFALIKGIGLAGSMVMAYLFCSDCVEYGAFKTGERAAGITFSIQTFTTKLISAVSGAFVMFLLAAAGFVEGADVAQPQSALNSIWMLYSLFPAIGGVLCLPILSRYKLRDKDVQIMAQVNSGELSMQEAEKKLSRIY